MVLQEPRGLRDPVRGPIPVELGPHVLDRPRVNVGEGRRIVRGEDPDVVLGPVHEPVQIDVLVGHAPVPRPLPRPSPAAIPRLESLIVHSLDGEDQLVAHHFEGGRIVCIADVRPDRLLVLIVHAEPSEDVEYEYDRQRDREHEQSQAHQSFCRQSLLTFPHALTFLILDFASATTTYPLSMFRRNPISASFFPSRSMLFQPLPPVYAPHPRSSNSLRISFTDFRSSKKPWETRSAMRPRGSSSVAEISRTRPVNCMCPMFVET